MPSNEMYLEVGTLEGRTLESAAKNNDDKRLVGCDPCLKYGAKPVDFGTCVSFYQKPYEELGYEELPLPIGVAFYDGDHSAPSTRKFFGWAEGFLANEAIVVLDDWDRESVRAGAFGATVPYINNWQLLREMPEYTDGLNCPPHHFGYYFGVSVWGYRR